MPSFTGVRESHTYTEDACESRRTSTAATQCRPEHRRYSSGGRADSPLSPSTVGESPHACAEEVCTRSRGLQVVLTDPRESYVGSYFTVVYMSSHTGRIIQQCRPTTHASLMTLELDQQATSRVRTPASSAPQSLIEITQALPDGDQHNWSLCYLQCWRRGTTPLSMLPRLFSWVPTWLFLASPMEIY
jgi:hypothetical protein